MCYSYRIFGIKQLARLDRCYAVIAQSARLHSNHVVIRVPKAQPMCENVQSIASKFLLISYALEGFYNNLHW